MINSHCYKSTEKIQIFNYDVIQTNKMEENHNGTAIAIIRDVKYRINEDYLTDILGVTIETKFGDVKIATIYIPQE